MRNPLVLTVVCWALSAQVYAENVVYDSLSGYTPESVPGPGGLPSWLSGDLEQGFILSRSHSEFPLIEAEFAVRNGGPAPQDSPVTLRFYADQGGVPASLLATVEDTISVSAQSTDVVSVELPGILLPDDPIWVTWDFGTARHVEGLTLGGTTTIGADFATRAYRRHPNGDLVIDQPFGPFGGGPAVRLIAAPEPSGVVCCVSLMAFVMRLRSRR